MTVERDLIRAILDRAIAIGKPLTVELAREIEVAVRNEWGGDRVNYIAKNVDRKRGQAPVPDEVVERVKADLARQLPLVEIASRNGISRGALYTLRKSKRVSTD